MLVRFGNLSYSNLFALLPLLACASCSFGPSRLKQPGISASGAGSAAIAAYDKNGDGVISGEELDRAPAIKAGLARLDSNGDKGVSADEIAERINTWKSMQTGITSFGFTVTLDGAPLPGATVTFQPDPSLGDDIKPASSTTNPIGAGGASIAKEDRPRPDSPPGMHLGLYTVKISKTVNGKELVPRKYNEETVLGQEVALDVPEIANNRVTYSLTTKPGK